MCDGVPLTETTTHNSTSPAKHSSKKNTSTSCLTLSILRLGFRESRTTTCLSTLKRRIATVLPLRSSGSSTARVGLNSKHPRAHKISPIGLSHLSQVGFWPNKQCSRKNRARASHLWHLSISHRLLSWLCKTIFFPMLEKNPYIFPD